MATTSKRGRQAGGERSSRGSLKPSSYGRGHAPSGDQPRGESSGTGDDHDPVCNRSERQLARREAQRHEIRRRGELELEVGETARPRRLLGEAALSDAHFVLDAWYASFASRASQALIRERAIVGDPVAENVIDEDDRQRITATQDYPWRAICSLLITAANGTGWSGTGWFISPRTIATAGHNLYIHQEGGWAQSITVIPGRNGTESPHGRHSSTHYCSVKGWRDRKDSRFDYGAILLDRPWGDDLGYFGFDNRSDSDLQSYQVNVAGYPGDKERGTLWWHARDVGEVNAHSFSYLVDTYRGQSGAPVWAKLEDDRVGLGIHTYGSDTSNSATRINQPVFDNLKRWKDGQ